jgi:hypothetical protein
MNLLRRLPSLRTGIGFAAAVIFGASAGFLFRGHDTDHTATAPTPAATVTTVGSPGRQQAVLTARLVDAWQIIRRGGVANVEFEARPGSSCQLEVQPTAAPGEGQRLGTRVTDAAGKVAWRWTVAEDLPEGTAQAVVVCSGGARAQVAIRIV